jgi:hypothetical protein
VPVPQTDSGRWEEDSKAIERSVGDGQLVIIPVPPKSVMSNGATEKDRRSGRLDVPV